MEEYFVLVLSAIQEGDVICIFLGLQNPYAISNYKPMACEGIDSAISSRCGKKQGCDSWLWHAEFRVRRKVMLLLETRGQEVAKIFYSI
jgi:hypothetical protein